jgi:ABC-type Fe2+-enterobactin transport system substrate-binding protein
MKTTKTLKLSGNMIAIPIDSATGDCVVDESHHPNLNKTANNPDGLCYARHIYDQQQAQRATPTPWQLVIDHHRITGADGSTIIYANGLGNSTANLSKAVQAVNEHAALVAVAEAARSLESQVVSVIMYDDHGEQGQTTDRNEPHRRLLRQALAQLAAIQGGGK